MWVYFDKLSIQSTFQQSRALQSEWMSKKIKSASYNQSGPKIEEIRLYINALSLLTKAITFD